MRTTTKIYVRIEHEDAELSTLNAINSVLKASGLDTIAQARVLQYTFARISVANAKPVPVPVPVPAVSVEAVAP